MESTCSTSPNASDEKFLNVQEWKVEAEGVIKDVENHVESISISHELSLSNESVFLNLTTLEKNAYTIELSAMGFRVMSTRHSDTSAPTETYFETPYSLLNSLSPLYRVKFCAELSSKLSALADRSQ